MTFSVSNSEEAHSPSVPHDLAYLVKICMYQSVSQSELRISDWDLLTNSVMFLGYENFASMLSSKVEIQQISTMGTENWIHSHLALSPVV